MTTNTPAEHQVVPFDLTKIPHPTDPATVHGPFDPRPEFGMAS
ncbi:hypothetical protein N1028_12540 [Herbiconiux sp. CPCC 203407]|uniref:Uncharacterized protein n=1 Tax=Herbiconiux oxytropis TaxID=2970915 RepID=A0AA41XEW7_9MICO|nr:hypothetical protein [Herbiconiux oxytropis]MCS5721651.1 hypothetical protein [Herbiconiux oxytropis]MCS5726722.1 hypothetical protein [Herbiconiux oxytropis]